MTNKFELVDDASQEQLFLIDFSKVKDANDLILILSSLGLTVSNKHPFFDNLQKFLVLDQPIDAKTGNLIKQ